MTDHLFTPQFDQIYRASYRSATGSDFDDPEVQEQYRTYTRDTTDALLSEWRAPDWEVVALTLEQRDRRSSVRYVEHPSAQEFDEKDAQSIAHIRFLGAQAIARARLAIQSNPNIDIDKDSTFLVSRWHDMHPDEPRGDEHSMVKDAASPLRLDDWPYGEYVSCLGVAIATAAQSELRGQPYLFVNCIRSSIGETARYTGLLFDQIQRFSVNSIASHMSLHNARYTRILADGKSQEDATREGRCFYETEGFDGFCEIGEELDTQFHCSVLRQNPSKYEWESTWEQYDPYALVCARIAPAGLGRFIDRNARIIDDRRCNNLMLLDGDMQEYSMDRLGKMVKLAGRSRARLYERLDSYKSRRYMPAVRDELITFLQSMRYQIEYHQNIESVADDELFLESSVDAVSPDLVREVDHIWGDVILKCYEFGVLDETLIAILQKYDARPESNIGHFFDAFESTPGLRRDLELGLQQGMKHDTNLRLLFRELVANIPYGYVLKKLEHQVTYDELSGKGMVDKTMEVGDPAFMIGSLYLNHYARWSESGIVNVAKEIARVNPSQLIWQAAVSFEAGAVLDDRVNALGAFIGSLRQSQQHPLVQLTPTTPRR